MEITVTRTGGFAGVHQQLGPVDTSSLDSEVAEQIDRIITELDFFNLQDSPAAGVVYDGFFYAVQVVADDRDHTVRTEDGSDDPAAGGLRRLIGLLEDAGCPFEDSPMDRPADEVVTRDWSAWYNRMPPVNHPDLHVSGTCYLQSSSTTVRLEPGNEGIIDDPELFVLRLVVTTPDIHDDRYVEREVSWQGDVGQGIKRVRINGASVEIPVTSAT
jgi:hypothetical protein